MCPVKQTAHRSPSRSPKYRLSIPPDMHSMYIPPRQTKTATYTILCNFFPSNPDTIATITTYVAVRNPDLPELATSSGYAAIPLCCRFVAKNIYGNKYQPIFENGVKYFK